MVLHLASLDDTGQRIARASFPEYRGRMYKVRPHDGPMSVVSFWDGGSRNYFALVRLADMAKLPVPQNGTMFDGGPLPDVSIPSGCVIVEHSIFCGKDMGLTFHVRKDEALALLPPVSEPLTADEKTVLWATSSYKASYNGDSHIRFHEAHRKTGITRERWETAKAAMIARKCLNKAGAITPAGRNALQV
jgi:hypothetical protein